MAQLYNENNRNSMAEMNEIKFQIGNNLIMFEDIIDATFYITCGQFCFPDKEWTDSVNDILATWTYQLLTWNKRRCLHIRLYFMDGAYRLDVSEDSPGILSIQFVNFRQMDKCIYTIQCSYMKFLLALFDAVNLFYDRLQESGLCGEKYTSICQDTKRLINRLAMEISKRK